MAKLFYFIRRCVAIALGLALTGYSAWASWSHSHDLIGPLAAVSAATLLALCEYAWRDRRWVHFGLLGLFGALAAIISGSVVLERVASTSAARTHQTRSANLPRVEARKALDEARADLEGLEAAIKAEISRHKKPGCGQACKGLKKEAKAARDRVARARAELVALGAKTAENPAASLFGPFAVTFQLATILGLPLWLELAAPAVLAYGFAPSPHKRIDPETVALQTALDARLAEIEKLKAALKRARKRLKEKEAPRKPPAPPATAEPPRRSTRLKVVGGNDA